MSVLPVLTRELRTTARHPVTYRLRIAAAGMTLAFCAFSLWFVEVALGARTIPPRELFIALSWITYVLAGLAGFVLTCDAISQEKRDSTLGLLFLTDLKGRDIVLGKLAAAALRGLFALFATIPMLALPIMMGGTNLGELSRTALVLVLTLIFSMSVGLLCSASAKRGWTAFASSGGILFVFALVLPAASLLTRNFFRDPQLAHWIEVWSPSYALLMSGSPLRTVGNGYVISLSLLSGLSLAALVGASLVTPRVWKDRPPKRRWARILEWIRTMKFGSARARQGLRARLLERNPVYWLSRREWVSAPGFMLLILLFGCVAGWFSSQDWSRLGGVQANAVIPFISWMLCVCVVHGFIFLRVAVTAAERFGEDRRSGALELLLSTPITVKKVLAGHWMGLRRYFAGPALMVAGLHCLVIALFLAVQAATYRNRVRTLGQAASEIFGQLTGSPYRDHDWDFHIVLLIMVGTIPLVILNWIALAWTSTWLSLRVKQAVAAPIAALVLVHAPPWLVFGATTFIEYRRAVPRAGFEPALWAALYAGALIAANQLLCIWFSRRKLLKHFRTAATDRYQPAAKKRWWWPRLK